MKKLLAIIMAALCCCLAACNQAEDTHPSEEQKPQVGTHQFLVEETGDYLVQNGKSDYVIVLPAEPNSYEKVAAEELVNLFFEATQIRLSVIADKNLAYAANAKFISIGETTLVEQAAVGVDYTTLGINGVGIYTVGKTVFLLGGSENGVVYSVYEFLHQTVGFEQFHTDYYYMDTFVRDIKLMKYQITDLPDIKRCIANIGYLVENKSARRRMRAAYEKDTLKASMNGAPADHVTLYYLPIATYYEEHDEWFSDDMKQLCYTAHGDAEELELMLDAFTASIQKAVIDSPGRPIVSVSNMDEQVWCGCEACKAELLKYGTDSAVYIKFINQVYDRMIDWFENDETGKQHYTPDFRLVLLAYHRVQNAPAKFNEATGEYEPIDQSVVLRDGVLVEYAPNSADYTLPMSHSTNSAYYNTFRAWGACAKEIAVWVYSTNFIYHLLPYNTFNSMEYNYDLFAGLNSQWIFDQSQYGAFGGATGWHTLKTYLNTKLAWNVNYDMDELIDHFFKNYFGVAAPEMRQFFESYRAFSAYQEEELGFSRGNQSIYFAALNKAYWPKHVIDTWKGYVNQALAKIAPLKDSHKSQYDILYKHIVQERVFLDYVLLENYSSFYDAEGLKALKLSFKEAVTLNKMTAIGEGAGGMAAYLEALGI